MRPPNDLLPQASPTCCGVMCGSAERHVVRLRTGNGLTRPVNTSGRTEGRRLRQLVTLIALTAAVAGCAREDSPREILIRAVDYAFQGPDSLRAGSVAFALDNAGKVPHEVIVVKLKPEATLAEIVRRERAESTWRHLREPPSGILTADPGVRTPGRLLVRLEKGHRYLLLCNFQDADTTPPHLQLGMARLVSAY